MTRMTRPDCAVMCNLINTHTHTHLSHSIVYYKGEIATKLVFYIADITRTLNHLLKFQDLYRYFQFLLRLNSKTFNNKVDRGQQLI